MRKPNFLPGGFLVLGAAGSYSVYIYICIYMCIYIYIYIYIFILYIITCVHIHICRDICIYVYTYFLKLPHSFSLIRPGVCWAWLVSQRVVALSLCKLENQPPKTG